MNKLRMEQILGVAAVALVAMGCLLVLRPFASALLWASILCFSTWPLFERLKRALGGRKGRAAGVMVLIISLLLIVPFTLVGTHLADNLSLVVDWFRVFKQDGLKPPPDWVKQLPLAGDLIARNWADLAANTERTMELLKQTLVKSELWLLRHSLAVLEGLAQLCLSVLIAFFFYRDGEAVVEMLVAGVRKIAGDDTQHLLATVGGTIKGVVYGVICTALAQGLAAGIGFRIAGIESALLLGFLTFILSFIPGGPPVVWVPVTAWLFFNSHPGMGAFMLVWGTLVISGVDNFVRPYVISRDTKQSFALILLGVLGGIIAFGFIGLFIGPTLLAVGATLIRQFVARKREPRGARPAHHDLAGPTEPPA